MTVEVLIDDRDQLGWGRVTIKAPSVGHLSIEFGDQSTRYANVTNRLGYTYPGQQFVPAVIVRTTAETALAPRSRYQVVGGFRLGLTEFYRDNPMNMLDRRDWRLLGSASEALYQDRIVSAAQWKDWSEALRPVAEWLAANVHMQKPVVDPYIENQHAQALNNAQRARARWQEAEAVLLTARDAYLAEVERVETALAVIGTP